MRRREASPASPDVKKRVIERNDDLMVDKIEIDIEEARTITERITVRGGTTRKTRYRRPLVQRPRAPRLAA